MPLEALISTYGYVAIAVGTFFEGETILVLAGFAAHRGYLDLPWVILSAFLGTLCGDQLYFYLGRVKGTQFVEKRPHWRSKSQRVFSLLHKHEKLLVLGFRFLYGFRTVTPFMLGASGLSPVRFLVLNAIGALLWAISIGVSGYLFGSGLELLIGDIKRYEVIVFVGLAIAGAVAWSIYTFRKQKARRKTEPPEK